MLKMLLPHAVMLATIGLFVAIALPLKWWSTRTRRRSPMTFPVRHLPGERVRSQLAAVDEQWSDRAATLLMMGSMVAATWLASRADLSDFRFGVFDGVLLVGLVGVVVYTVVTLRRSAERRRQLSDGLYAELATAQELTPLLAKGYQVVHNVTGDGFDIDHVVIGPSCVWTIESKSRRKPRTGGKEAATVTVDGKSLRFPDWVETRPLEQARAQARWLSDYLRKRNGAAVEVRPAISLLGWYVQRTAPSDVVVVSTNGIGRSRLFDVPGTTPIDQDARVRIVAALEERVEVHEGDKEK